MKNKKTSSPRRRYASIHLDLEYDALMKGLLRPHQKRVDLLREMIDERIATQQDQAA